MKIVDVIENALVNKTIIVYKYDSVNFGEIEYHVERAHEDDEDEDYLLMDTIEFKVEKVYTGEHDSNLLLVGQHEGEALSFEIGLYDDVRFI
jgi:hypothetical protein